MRRDRWGTGGAGVRIGRERGGWGNARRTVGSVDGGTDQREIRSIKNIRPMTFEMQGIISGAGGRMMDCGGRQGRA